MDWKLLIIIGGNLLSIMVAAFVYRIIRVSIENQVRVVGEINRKEINRARLRFLYGLYLVSVFCLMIFSYLIFY